jgi:quinol monooxygenase YgiN
MINRIVKMTFHPAHVDEFVYYFDTIKHQINSFEGCHSMKMLRDVRHPHILFTYSIWESEEALNNYRHSELFASVWPKTKQFFSEKAEAWSTEVYFDGAQAKSC